MPWCPKCKNEYVDGITQCADCGCLLVASLEEEQEAVIFGDLEQMSRLVSFMEYNGITSARLQEDEADQVYEIFVSRRESEAAKRAARVFLTEEAQKRQTGAAEQAETVQEEEDEEDRPGGVYKDNAQKAAEFRDSGYTLLGVGIVGLTAVVLLACGVIRFQLGGNQYFVYSVMGAMFLLFIVIGARSIRSSHLYRKEAVTEGNLKEKIMSWCRESLTAAEIDEIFSGEELSEEEKYFRRTEQIRKLISHKFINLESGFLDNLIDEFYPELFGQDRE